MILDSLAMTGITLTGLGTIVALPAAFIEGYRIRKDKRMGRMKEAAAVAPAADLPLLIYAATIDHDRGPYTAVVTRRQLPDRVWQMEKLLKRERDPRDEIEKRFLAYHFENPNVYGMFDHWTKIAITEHRRTKFSHWNVFNRIRWEYAIEADDPEADFKISNDYLGLYARLWMERNPKYIDFFDTKLRAPERDLIEAQGLTVETAKA